MAGRDVRTLGQERGELDPQGLEQADWQDRHGTSTAEMADTSTVAGARAWLLLPFNHGPIVGRSKLGFVHLVDRMREAGYRGLTPHCQERVSHGSPASRDCTRPAGL